LSLEIPNLAFLCLDVRPSTHQSLIDQPVIEAVIIRELGADLLFRSLILKPINTHGITPHQISPKKPYNAGRNAAIPYSSTCACVNRKLRLRPPPPLLTRLIRTHLPQIYDLFVRFRWFEAGLSVELLRRRFFGDLLEFVGWQPCPFTLRI
jgi:hypothetical protein